MHLCVVAVFLQIRAVTKPDNFPGKHRVIPRIRKKDKKKVLV